MNNTYTVKNSAGKTVSFELPAVPAGFINGVRVINVLKRFLKANVNNMKECKRELKHVEDIFSAPRLTLVEMETWYKSDKSNVCNGEILLSVGNTCNFSNGTAGGGGYDKASGAISDALYNNTFKASFDRLLIECYSKLKSECIYHVGGFGDKKKCSLPSLSICGVGMASFADIFRQCGFKGNLVQLHNCHYYGKYTK